MTSPSIPLIRPLVKNDLAAMAEIEAELQSFPWTALQFIESYTDGHRGWVAEVGNTVVGFAMTSQVIDELSLLTLGVRPSHQRQGIARALIERIIDSAREYGAAFMLLEVRKSNKAARALYRQLGFAENGLRKGYYRAEEGREDAILMSLIMDEGSR